MRRPTPAPRRSRRVLPPLTRGPETLEGGRLLDEVEGDAGVVLWQSLRNVQLWTSAEPEGRHALFAAGAAARRQEVLSLVGVDRAVEGPLRVIAALLSQPGETAEGPIAEACLAISAWAEERGAAGTALAFMQAAALLLPGDAGLAYGVGRLARACGEAVRAEGWLLRAAALARAGEDWDGYTRALLALGTLWLQRGSAARARRIHLRALRTARRHRLAAQEAAALHHLFAAAAQLDDEAEALGRASAALAAYGAGHARIPDLAHDVGRFWVSRGACERALPVLRAAAARLRGAGDRAVALADVARAAAGCGDEATYLESARQVRRLLALPEADASAGRALLGLAHAAAARGEMETAALAASAAARAAARRGDEPVRAAADRLRAAARRGHPAPAPAAARADDAADALARRFVRSLTPPSPA